MIGKKTPGRRRAATLGSLVCIGLAALPAAHAQDAPTGTQVSRELVNPLTRLDHLPLRLDWDTQIGGFDEGKRQTLAAEPAFSFDLAGGGRLVARTLVPLVRLDGVADDGSTTGLGDVVQTIYYVPASVAHATGFAWGIGGVLRLPAATDDLLGRDAWALGPAVAATWTGEYWIWGAQLQHQFAVGGDNEDEESDEDITLVQPFVARAFGRGWSSGVQVDAAFDWDRDRLKGPLTLFARKAFSSEGGSAYAFDAGFRYWVDGPTEEPEWGVRLGFAWVFE